VIGVDGGAPTETASAHLDQAQLVVGRKTHLQAYARPTSRWLETSGNFDRLLSEIEYSAEPVVVLASGDPGFFGIVRALCHRLGRGRLQVIPAVSSIARAFASAGLNWDDAIVVSAHGRLPHAAINAVRAHPKVCVLTAPDFGPAELALAVEPIERHYIVCEQLGSETERITELGPRELAGTDFTDPNVVIALASEHTGGAKQTLWPARGPSRWALPEAAFHHRASMITKREVRAYALSCLGPGVGDLVWDVGAGSGSVCIECARLGAATVAVERDPDACQTIEANATAHGVFVQVVCAQAPQALADLPDPDAVFIGGAGQALFETVQASAARARRSVVVALATFDRVTPVAELLKSSGYEVDTTMLQSARVQPISTANRLEAQNPVFVVCARRDPAAANVGER
jgi:precorrin-6B C5,15-methyltransferase / cobalt-precorrin-6B C5,C15-methyltransferase